jgi:large subunit ribosomal protein L35
MKTHKALAKRFKVTKKGKVLKRKAGQAHFNTRETGNTSRKKRRDISQEGKFQRNIKKLMIQQ